MVSTSSPAKGFPARHEHTISAHRHVALRTPFYIAKESAGVLSQWFYPGVNLAELQIQYPDWLNWFTAHGAQNDVGVILALDAEVLAGLIVFSQRRDGMKIDTFFVLPDYRKKGMSRLLWSALAERLGDVRLEVTLKTAALRAWGPTLQSRGFKDVSSEEERQQGKFRFTSVSWRTLAR